MDKNKQSYICVGKLDIVIARRWKLEEHANKPIVVFEDRKQHIIDRHLKDFNGIKEIDYIWSKLSYIIKYPDNVFYNEKTRGLEYYKKINDIIVVAVRINFGSILKIKSFYPANKNKLNNRLSKEVEMIINGKI